MRGAAKELEFERAAALRDEIQQIRLRVLEQDASVTVARAAERAAGDGGLAGRRGLTGAADRARGRRAADEAAAAGTGHGGHQRHGPARGGGAGRDARRRARRATAPRPTGCRDPRRARGRRRLAGALARPADLGSDGHAEHPQAHRPASRSNRTSARLGDLRRGVGRAGVAHCSRFVRSRRYGSSRRRIAMPLGRTCGV